jgi:hypothetical protein
MSEKDHRASIKMKHEVERIQLKPLIHFFLWLGLSTVFVGVLMWALFGFLERRAESNDPPPSPLAGERQVIPPEPRLQLSPGTEEQTAPNPMEHPLEELKTLRAEEEQAVTSYGWIDEKAGVVRLPIERAKQLLLERGGLPSRSESNQQPADVKGVADSKPAAKAQEAQR